MSRNDRAYVACRYCGFSRLAASYEHGALYPCRSCASSYLLWLRPVGSWVRDAACAEVDPDLWFPHYETPNSRDVQAAKSVCATCPVQTQCLQHALDVDEPHGVWGGLTPVERKRLKKKGGSAA